MFRKRKFDSPSTNTAVTAEKKKSLKSLSLRKSIITKVMICLDLFAIIVMEKDIKAFSVLLPNISVKYINFTVIRRIL